MDHAVGIVESYLRVNGFVTVVEFPILERAKGGGMREATEIDIVAWRSPHAGRAAPALDMRGKLTTHPPLDIDPGRGEWIIAEVKEGAAGTNPGMMRRGVLKEVLRRFGIVPRDHLRGAVEDLRREGQATVAGNRVRIVSFGVRKPERPVVGTVVYLGAVADFLEDYVEQHVQGGGATRFRDPVLGLLAVREKTFQ